LEIGPSFGLPPVESCRGTSPIQAAKSRPERKAFGSVTGIAASSHRSAGESRPAVVVEMAALDWDDGLVSEHAHNLGGSAHSLVEPPYRVHVPSPSGCLDRRQSSHRTAKPVGLACLVDY
jgi:hypothetical protein